MWRARRIVICAINSGGLRPRVNPKQWVAIAHDILVLAYFVLRRGTPYVEKGPKELTEPHKQRIIRHHVRRLGTLGIRVRVHPKLASSSKRSKESNASD